MNPTMEKAGQDAAKRAAVLCGKRNPACCGLGFEIDGVQGTEGMGQHRNFVIFLMLLLGIPPPITSAKAGGYAASMQSNRIEATNILKKEHINR